VADNLGLRAIEESVTAVGNMWTTLKLSGREKVHKVVFVIVNAEKKVDDSWEKNEWIPPFGAMLSSYSSIVISRYNQETVALLQESFERWAQEVRTGRCPPGQISTDPGACGDITFYLADVKFAGLEDAEERAYLDKLPTSFRAQRRRETGSEDDREAIQKYPGCHE
jgi:NTE family protein